jgi:hypothetical protein
MSFLDYRTRQQVETEYQIRYQEVDFVPEEWTETSVIFDIDFEFHETCVNTSVSHVAQRELMTLPILKELYQNCGGIQGSPDFWIAPYLKADKQLCGNVDYLIAARSENNARDIGKPILVVVVQVKQNNFEAAWGHCLAALVASKKINDCTNPVYGIVTNGTHWELGYLHNQIFTKNPESLAITNLEHLFGQLNGFFGLATQNLAPLGSSK